MLLFFWVIFDMGTLSNHRRTRRCLVKNAVPKTENRPLQIIYLAYPDRTIYNKRRIQFSLVHLGSMVVMFFCCVLVTSVNACFLKIVFMHQSLRYMSNPPNSRKTAHFLVFVAFRVFH